MTVQKSFSQLTELELIVLPKFRPKFEALFRLKSINQKAAAAALGTASCVQMWQSYRVE